MSEREVRPCNATELGRRCIFDLGHSGWHVDNDGWQWSPGPAPDLFYASTADLASAAHRLAETMPVGPDRDVVRAAATRLRWHSSPRPLTPSLADACDAVDAELAERQRDVAALTAVRDALTRLKRVAS